MWSVADPGFPVGVWQLRWGMSDAGAFLGKCQCVLKRKNWVPMGGPLGEAAGGTHWIRHWRYLHTATVIVCHLPYIVVTSTDMAASCKAVELRINP